MIKHLLALSLLATPLAAQDANTALSVMGEQCVDGLMRDLRAGPSGMMAADAATNATILSGAGGNVWTAGNLVLFDLDQSPVCGIYMVETPISGQAIGQWASRWQLTEAPQEAGTRRFIRRYSDAEVLMVFVASSQNPQLVEITGRILPANDWTNRILAGGN